MVRAGGDIHALGDARTLAAWPSNPCGIVGVAAIPSGRGLVALRDSGVVQTTADARHWGDGAFLGEHDFTGLAPTPSGRGYYLGRANGEVIGFSDAVPRVIIPGGPCEKCSP